MTSRMPLMPHGSQNIIPSVTDGRLACSDAWRCHCATVRAARVILGRLVLSFLPILVEVRRLAAFRMLQPTAWCSSAEGHGSASTREIPQRAHHHSWHEQAVFLAIPSTASHHAVVTAFTGLRLLRLIRLIAVIKVCAYSLHVSYLPTLPPVRPNTRPGYAQGTDGADYRITAAEARLETTSPKFAAVMCAAFVFCCSAERNNAAAALAVGNDNLHDNVSTRTPQDCVYMTLSVA